jgi:hypothetical protein
MGAPEPLATDHAAEIVDFCCHPERSGDLLFRPMQEKSGFLGKTGHRNDSFEFIRCQGTAISLRL